MPPVEHIHYILDNFKQAVASVFSENELLNLKSEYLGKDGLVTSLSKSLSTATLDEKKQMGRVVNTLKQDIQELFDVRLHQLKQEQVARQLASTFVDVTDRFLLRDRGLVDAGYHPLTLIRREVEDAFLSMGFDILDGPYVEDDFHNFTALNIPADHPARDMQDTFWFSDKVHCLRTQTSPMQIRGMQHYAPPFKFVAPGKVFRNEKVDASHEMAFHQIEAMVVGHDISVAHMVHFLQQLLSAVFKSDIKVRLRTGYFPFVEPGFELDISCTLCSGQGCPVCKQSGWLEFCGCGLVHPHVLQAGGIDSTKWSGFAFGMGWDRLVMMRYGIDDIRHIHSGDLRFVRQFSSY
jgi:phenylalanyl-tRNA synthetase alpha chain